MRSQSIQSLFALLTLVSAGSAKAPANPPLYDVVTAIIKSTITTCPTTPPPPCSSPAETRSSSSVAPTSSGSSVLRSSSTHSSRTAATSTASVYSSLSTTCYSPSSSASSARSSSAGSSPSSHSIPISTPPASSSRSSSTSSSTASSSSPACTDYFLQTIKHQGKAPYAPAGYKIFRNVKDYGAKGDGVADDTAAINLAISDGGRCAPGSCSSSTTTPALVYFPNGTYLVSAPIVDYYYTQIIGNPSCLPVIKASSNFNSPWVIDGDQYQPNGKLAWGATNVFWRQIRNLVIDMTSVPPSQAVAGVHWPTGQATSLSNIVFKMSAAAGTMHQGLFIEEGSGGYVGDLVFYGGARGLQTGNQQFTMRNLTFYGCVTAIQQLWDWGWTYKGLSINNCQVGLDITGINNGKLTAGSITLTDSEITNTPVGIAFGNTAASGPPVANNMILEHVRLNNVPVAIQGPGQSVVLPGSAGLSTISAWGRGNRYTPTGPTVFEGAIAPNSRPAGLLSGTDYYERSKPQYRTMPLSQFVSARDAGAAGDGVTDDTAVINTLLLSAAAAGRIVFFDAGTYLVRGTIFIPAGSKIVGEAYPVILSSGSFFADMNNPKPVVQVGKPGNVGQIEWSDMIVSSKGAQAGAILIEWNLASRGTPSGMWDVHTRVGGFRGSDLLVADCPKTPAVTITPGNLATQCIAAFMSMHITSSAAGLYMENVWLWVADHDVEDAALSQITIYAGRGLHVESTAGRIWLYGTAVEHHVLYEYQFYKTKDVIMGQIQTETAYYQPNPDATIPFPVNSAFHDPVLSSGTSGWGLRIVDSSSMLIYGAGLYSFFNNYDLTCSNEGNTAKCQTRIFSVENSSVSLYNLNTIGTTKMITVSGVDVADYSENQDGFIQSIALFRT